MLPYTNKESFVASWSEREYDVLSKGVNDLSDAARFLAVSYQARDYIDSYLYSGGYVLPVAFTPFGVVQDVLIIPPLEYLNGTLQKASDAITAYFLAQSTDRMKKPYQEAFLKWDAYFRDVANNKITLFFLQKRNNGAGLGSFSVLTRPRLFTGNTSVIPIPDSNTTQFFYNGLTNVPNTDP